MISTYQTPKLTRYIAKCFNKECNNTVTIEKRRHLPGLCKHCRRKGKIRSAAINAYAHLLRETTYNSACKPVYHFHCSTPNCKNITVPRRSSLVKGPPLCKECNDRKMQKRPYESALRTLQRGAKERGHIVDLTYEEFIALCEVPTCHYCGKDLNRTKYRSEGHGSPSLLDRKDSSLGYSKENCVPCCWECNNLKGAKFSYEEFKLILLIKEKKWSELYKVCLTNEVNQCEY